MWLSVLTLGQTMDAFSLRLQFLAQKIDSKASRLVSI